MMVGLFFLLGWMLAACAGDNGTTASGKGLIPTALERTRGTAAGAPVMKASAETLRYQRPSGAPGSKLEQSVAAPVAITWDAVQQTLAAAGFTFSELDERTGLIVARYGGEPRDFVDCGTIVGEDAATGVAWREDATAPRLTLARSTGDRLVTIERTLLLDARLVVQIRPDGEGSFLQAIANYVVSKKTDAWSDPGTRYASGIESIGFSTGGSSRFAKGTECWPTGRLERLVQPASA